MEEKLYIGNIHAEKTIIEEQFSGDSVNTLAAFRLRNDYLQNWRDRKIKIFSLSRKKRLQIISHI